MGVKWPRPRPCWHSRMAAGRVVGDGSPSPLSSATVAADSTSYRFSSRRRQRYHRRRSERAVAASRGRNAAGQLANGEPRALREEFVAFLSTSAPLALVALAVVVGALALVFAGCLDNEFITWDDDIYIYANPHLQSLTVDNLYWMLTNASWMYWHPLAYFSHAIDFTIGGANPRVHHLTSVLLHGVNVLLVLGLFIVVLLDSRRRRPAKDPQLQYGIWAIGIALAVLFGVHPLRVESVAWAAEKKDLLCALFVLVAVIMHFFYADALSGRERKLLYGCLCVAAGLALLSKAMAVTLPALLLILDVYPLRRHERLPLRALLLEKLPVAAMSFAVLLINVLSVKDADRVVTAGVIGWSDRLLLASWGFVFPFAKTLWPTDLVPIYPLPLPAELTLSNPRYLFSALALVAMTLFCGFQWRRGSRGWLAAWACYLVLMTPVSGLRTLGSIATADRFAYLPMLSFTLLAGAGLVCRWQRARERYSPRLVMTGLCLALATIATVLGFRAAAQVEV